MSHKNAVEYTAIVSCEEAAKHLEALADGLRRGRAVIETSDKSLALDLGENVKLELEAALDLRKGKGSIEVSIGWRSAEILPEAAGALAISAAEKSDDAWMASDDGQQESDADSLEAKADSDSNLF